jgi:hypothetical protein
MSSIIRRGETFRGISVFGRGVFTDDMYGGRTYAGQCKDGNACGLGVATWLSEYKEYADYGPDGQCDGRYLGRYVSGTTTYRLFERGEEKDSAPPPFIAAHSPPSNLPMDRPARFAFAGAGDRRGHRGAHPFRTPSLVVARHNPTASTLQSTSTTAQRRVHATDLP